MEMTSLERRRYFHLPHSQTSDYILISHYILQQEMESSLWKSPLFTSSPCLGVWEISMEMSPPARDGSRLCGNPLSSPVVPVWGCGRYRWRCPLQQEMESSLWKSPLLSGGVRDIDGDVPSRKRWSRLCGNPLFTSSPCLGVWEISMEMSPPGRDGVVSVEITSLHQ